MKRLLLILALCAQLHAQRILAPIMAGAPAVAGGPTIAHATAAPEGTCWRGAVCTLTIPATASGNTLVAYFAESTSAGAAASITATGATFAHKCNALHLPGGTPVATITVDMAYNVSAGITSVLYGGDSNGEHFMVVEWTGLIVGDPSDQCNGTVNGVAHANAQSSGSITTGVANTAVTAFFSEFFIGGAVTYAVLSPFTAISAGSSSSNQMYGGYDILTGTATINGTANSSDTSGNTVGATISLKY